MKTIAIIGQKGGTGKTTLAEILLVGFDRAGFTVAGIDLDPQTSLCTWSDARAEESPLIIPMQHSRLSKTLETAKADGVQVCVIDSAGRAEQAALKAAQAADLVLMPVQPTSADLMTVESTGEILRMAKTPASFAVLIRVKSQGTRHEEAAAFIQGLGFEVCPITIGERVTYQDAAAAGQTPQEYEPLGKAAIECDNVVKFTREQLNI